MKKIFYLFALVAFLFTGINAQNITINPRVKSVEGPNSGSKYAQAIVTNDSNASVNDTLFSWTIIEYGLPSGWEFSFCDNFDCYYNIGLNSMRTFILHPGESGPLKGDFIFNGSGGNAQVKVVVKSLTNTNLIDTFTMVAKGWATGLSNVNKKAEVSFYPNPAKDVVTIKYNTNKNIDVTIYNVLGTKVKTFVMNNGEASINISELQKGMYFISFNDNGTLVSKSFTKAD